MRIVSWLAAACVVACHTSVLPAAAQDDWPQFRGPTGQGIGESANPPVRWSQTENVAWKQPIPGKGWSSPIVYRDRIYLTTALLDGDGNPKSLRAICLDAKDGTSLWNEEVFALGDSPRKHDKNSHASPTPIAADDHLYVHFGHLGTACLALDGRTVWRQTGLAYDPVHGNGGSPILVDDKVVFSCDGGDDPFVVALDRATGDVVWKASRETGASKKFSFSTPLLVQEDGRRMIVSPGSGAVCAYAPDDGKELWRVDYGSGYSVVPRPVFGHGMVFVGTGFNRASVYASRVNGDGDVTQSHLVWTTSRGAPLTPSMLLIGSELYYVSDGGVASCVDALTGEQHWQQRVGGDVSASPVFAQGRIYVTTEDGKTVVLKAGLKSEVLAENDLKEPVLASLAIAGRAIFLRTEGQLYRIEGE